MQDIYIGDEGKGFPLVLVHGFLGSSTMWKPQIDFLKDHFRVITPDLPGFGKSKKAKPHNSIQSMSNLILDCLEEKKVSKFHLLGHSMGGMVVQEMAIKKGYLKKEEIASVSNTAHQSMLTMPTISKEEISGLAKVFSLYVKFPKERWPEIKIAEKDDDEGNKMMAKLGVEFDKTYRQIAATAFGTSIDKDELIFEEKDETFTCSISITTDEKFFIIATSDQITT